MSKVLRHSVLTLVILLFIVPVIAQGSDKLTEEQLRQIRDVIAEESMLLQQELEESRAIEQRIRELRARSVESQLPQLLERLVAQNDYESIQKEFDKMGGQLDVLMVRDPVKADSLLKVVSRLFRDFLFLQDNLDYYAAGITFYKNDDYGAESRLEEFFASYPSSDVFLKAAVLYIKVLLYTGQDQKAIDFYTKNPDLASPEVLNLIAHAYYNVGNDAKALALFRRLQADKVFGDDALLMSRLIVAISSDIKQAIQDFSQLERVYQNEPFIILALARMHVNAGNWAEAEKYYQRYYKLISDGREVLSLYEMALSLLNSGNKSEAHKILTDLLARKDTGSIYSSVLYLWSELESEAGRINNAQQKMHGYIELIDRIGALLPQKTAIFNRIEGLKQRVLNDPSQQSLSAIAIEIEQMRNQFAIIHDNLTQSPSGLSIHLLNRLYNYELSRIAQFVRLFDEYNQANLLRFKPMQTEIKKVEAVHRVYHDFLVQQEQELVVFNDIHNRLKGELQRLVEADLQLNRQIEIRRNIDVFNTILTQIDLLEQRGTHRQEHFDTIRAEYQAKKQEMELLFAYYDYDVTHYDELYTEINLLNEENQKQQQLIIEERQFIDSRRDYLVRQYQTIKPEQLADKEMQRVRDRIESQIAVTDQYLSELDDIQLRLASFKSDISFIDLQLAYSDLWKQARAREAKSAELTFEEADRQLQAINQQRKQLYARITLFIKDNPNFSAFEQPAGFGKLIGVSHLYNKLAELHYAIYPTDPTNALVHYRKVLEIDPRFYLRDAVQYNIGFISNFLIRFELDNAIDKFFDLNPQATTRPEHLRYGEDKFQETILAFKDIFDNFKDSPLFEEAAYRLGTLYFQIGTDAPEPIRFYDIARNYYNALVDKETSPYRYEALYQRGWTYLNSNLEQHFKLALDDFIQILQAIDDGKITDPTEIKSYLYTSVQNIGYCLTAIDGTDFISPAKGAQYVLTNPATYSNLDLVEKMVGVAIKTKLELQAPMQAIDFMRAMIQLRPHALDNPTRLDSIITTYYRYRNQLRPGQGIDDIRYGINLEIISAYHRESQWFITHKDHVEFRDQLAIVRKAYLDIEYRLNSNFLNNPNPETYAAYLSHIDRIHSFAEIHGDDYPSWYLGRRENIIAHGDLLARKTNDPLVYINTIDMIYALRAELTDQAKLFNYEGLAFRFAQTVHDSLAPQLIEYSKSNPDLKLPSSSDDIYLWYKNIANRFLTILVSDTYRSPENVRLYSQILFNLADKEFERGWYQYATVHYIKLLEIRDALTGPEVRGLYIQLARISENEKKYRDAENWYRQALDYAQNAEDRAMLYSLALYQIQRIIDEAEESNNFELAASQYLRLAEEFKVSDSNRSTGYMMESHKALVKSNQYQSSIDILLQVAAEKTSVQDVYVLYFDAWNIADSLMNRKDLAARLQNEFMEKYPSSNETFRLRVSNIERKAQNPQTRNEAADLYLMLHQDAKAKRVDTKDIPEEQIFLWALDVVQQTRDEKRLNQLLEGFIQEYPRHNLVVPYMMRITDYALAQGDTLKSDRLAKEIFQKEKSNFIRYENVARRNLRKVAIEFENAYQNQNWTLAFAKRDEFKKMEADYQREGLNLSFQALYAEFNNAQKAYDAIQAKNAFCRRFDTQMTALENGFVKRRPADLISVSTRTTWKNHLTGGRPNLLSAFKRQVTDEINKVIALIREGQQFDLDNARSLRALSHIAAINEFAAHVVKTAIARYIEVSWEVGEYRNRRNYSKEDYDFIVGGINRMRDDYAQEYLNAAYRSYLEIYDNYHLAGYTNVHTLRARSKLEEWNALPPYKVETYLLGDGWEISMGKIGASDPRTAAGLKGETVSPKGQKLSVVDIPPNHELVLGRTFRARVAPEFGLAQIVFPYDASFSINKTKIEAPIYTRVDTLNASQPFLTTQFAVPLQHNYWTAGTNQVEMRFPNTSAKNLEFHFAMKVIYNTATLKAAIPVETVKINTDNRWDALVFDPVTDRFVAVQSVAATRFNIPVASIDEISETQASPIWVTESSENPVKRVMFKRSFIIDTEFREGYLVFVAPQSATVLLNGHNLGDNYGFMYDPDPLAVYPNMVYFDSSQIVKGRNEIQIIVDNVSDFRGFLAEISFKILGKEEL